MRFLSLPLAALACAATLPALAQTPAPTATPAGTPAAADNTKVNERDRSGATKTPMDQSNDPADVKITASIRKMLMDDKAISTTGKNVKIITAKGGVVTLRGPVTSAEEKKRVEDHARMVVPAERVTSELEVAPPKK